MFIRCAHVQSASTELLLLSIPNEPLGRAFCWYWGCNDVTLVHAKGLILERKMSLCDTLAVKVQSLGTAQPRTMSWGVHINNLGRY